MRTARRGALRRPSTQHLQEHAFALTSDETLRNQMPMVKLYFQADTRLSNKTRQTSICRQGNTTVQDFHTAANTDTQTPTQSKILLQVPATTGKKAQ